MIDAMRELANVLAGERIPFLDGPFRCLRDACPLEFDFKVREGDRFLFTHRQTGTSLEIRPWARHQLCVAPGADFGPMDLTTWNAMWKEWNGNR